MKEKCPYCKLELEAEDLEKHKFECASSYQECSFNFENKIPCEICQELIDFDKYSEHISICSQPTGSIPFLLGRFNSSSSDFFRILNIPTPPNLNPDIYNPDDIDNGNENEQGENLNSSQEINIDDSLPVSNNSNDNLYEGNNALDENENENENDNLNTETDGSANISRESANTMQYNINLINYNMNLINNLLRNSQFRNEYVGDTYESLSFLDENVIKEGLDVEKVSELYGLVEKTKCPICLEDFEAGEQFRKIKCKHTFCDECLGDWLEENKKCPVCMIEIE